MIRYEVDVREAGRNYPHYWELCVGSCHAATILREDVRAQIRRAHEECGFRYLRFHGLFDDDMSVVISNFMTPVPEISFFNIDSIFDFLLSIGMKPFVEIGFMPSYLASGKKTCFHYNGNVTQPRDHALWADLIRQFGGHLISRYGKEEVAQWFFEVWNEPNLGFFFEGGQADYFRLYETTARALKEVDPCIRVGGPATSNNAWIADFVAFCEEGNVPLDFITTHHYPSDDPLAEFGKNGDDASAGLGELETLPSEQLAEFAKKMEAQMAETMAATRQNNPRDILRQMTERAKREAGEYPLYYTEWNVSEKHDTSYHAAGIVQTLAYNEGLVEGYSFWTVSDIFEEMGMSGIPFKDAFGLLTIHGIAKPVYRVFEALHRAGDRRLSVRGEAHRTAEALALTDGRRVTVFAYNFDIFSREIQAEEMELVFHGQIRSVKRAVIDAGHCNPKKTWEEMGAPKYLSAEQIAALTAASGPEHEELAVNETDRNVYRFTAEPESVTIFEIEVV